VACHVRRQRFALLALAGDIIQHRLELVRRVKILSRATTAPSSKNRSVGVNWTSSMRASAFSLIARPSARSSRSPQC
jgi:hypothetical protein